MCEKLNISVRTLMACVSQCFRCKFDMPSGPMEDVFLPTDGLTSLLGYE